MSTPRTIVTTTPQSPVILAANPSAPLAIQALSATEQMNQQVIGEMTITLKSFEKLLTNMQKTLDATIQENGLLKKRIVQLETKSKENEALHAAEMKKNTQANATLSRSVKSLDSDLKAETNARITLRKDFEKLAGIYNGHIHPCPVMFNPNTVSYYRNSGTPSKRYTL